MHTHKYTTTGGLIATRDSMQHALSVLQKAGKTDNEHTVWLAAEVAKYNAEITRRYAEDD